jgi:hypothetical protein
MGGLLRRVALRVNGAADAGPRAIPVQRPGAAAPLAPGPLSTGLVARHRIATYITARRARSVALCVVLPPAPTTRPTGIGAPSVGRARPPPRPEHRAPDRADVGPPDPPAAAAPRLRRADGAEGRPRAPFSYSLG